MEDTKGYDLLMVENEDGLYLVEAPAFKASVDGLVLFDGGKIGRIVKRAQWCLHSRLKNCLISHGRIPEAGRRANER